MVTSDHGGLEKASASAEGGSSSAQDLGVQQSVCNYTGEKGKSKEMEAHSSLGQEVMKNVNKVGCTGPSLPLTPSARSALRR